MPITTSGWFTDMEQLKPEGLRADVAYDETRRRTTGELLVKGFGVMSDRWTVFREWVERRPRWQQVVLVILTLWITLQVVGFTASVFGDDDGDIATPATTTKPAAMVTTLPPATAPAISSSSIEYKMAVIDGQSVPSDSVLSRYERAMASSVRNCPKNTKQQIADMSVKSTQILAENGLQATTLEMVEALNTSVSGIDVGDCTDVLATLIALMVSG